MTTRRWARRCSPAATTATSTPSCRRVRHQGGAQRLGLHAGHRELDRRHRVLGEPEDTVDVAAGLGDLGGDRRGRLRGEGVPEHGDQGTPQPARPVVAEAGDDLRLHLDRLRPAVDGRPQITLQPGGRRGHERAQHHSATGDDLLDVDHVDGVGGEGVEEACRDARPVLAEDLDEKGGDVGGRGLRSAHGAPTVSGTQCLRARGPPDGHGTLGGAPVCAGLTSRPRLRLPTAPPHRILAGGRFTGPACGLPGGGGGGGGGGGWRRWMRRRWRSVVRAGLDRPRTVPPAVREDRGDRGGGSNGRAMWARRTRRRRAARAVGPTRLVGRPCVLRFA